MKTLAFLLCICFLIPFSALAEEANTIDELVGMYNNQKCKECHVQQYNEWKESFHAISVVDSITGMRNFFAIGVPEEWERKLTKTEVLKCLDCHAPVVNYASEELAVKIANMVIETKDTMDDKRRTELKKELSKLNVGCLSCHNIKATTISMGLLGKPERGVIYTKKQVISPAHKTLPVNTLDKSLFCAQCHGRYVAADGDQIMCNTLNGSYYDSYVGQGGSETCQDCHMKKADRGHRFPGGHDLDIVKEGIGFNAEIAGVKHTVGKWIPRAIINVALENKAGHRIPDG
jgi:hypothetical protein